jgi:ferredoxin
VKVMIADGLCQGHARCETLCPEVFEVDAAGFASVRVEDVPAELEAAVRDAERNCPERAIVIESTVPAE